jgi:pimeloyl-ACP methyl ester carboxylesterase
MVSTPGRLTTSEGTLVYDRIAGAAPGVIFLHGLNSDRNGNKAKALAAYCAAHGYGCLRYDTYGHGESSGRFEDGGPSLWRDAAVAVIDELTTGPQILVGSSMGGWVMLLAALARPERVAGLIGIAAAPDFTDEMMAATLTAEQRGDFARQGYLEIVSPYMEPPMRISRHLIDDGDRNRLLGGPIELSCPVHLLHGQRDDSVPWRRAMQIAEKLTGGDVNVTLIKDGDHRLSRDQDLALLCRTLDHMVERVQA